MAAIAFESCADASSSFTYTEADAAWLSRHQHRKVLDPRVRVIGVGARAVDDGHPLVLVCYPLRTTATSLGSAIKGRRQVQKAAEDADVKPWEENINDEPSEEAAARKKDTRGGSSRKWQADKPVPWPNHLWLVCPTLTHRVGRLEHMGLVQDYQAALARDDTVLAEELAAAHRAYGSARWAALSEDDRAYCERSNYSHVLRDTGVGGLRFVSQVKCLHAHLAHSLSGKDNPIGRRVLEALARGDDAKAGRSADVPGEELQAGAT